MSNVLFTKRAQKELSTIPKNEAKAIVKKIAQLAVPFPKNLDIKKLVGVPRFYRLRKGVYRILFEIEETHSITIWIRSISHRKDAYRK